MEGKVPSGAQDSETTGSAEKK
ncbi:polyamine transporter tpo5 [Colletotrichum musicola]|uniref:Polyamine transporter tpo5 n=2 Tax=Colletotrichum orchidearum species complex TaxID=2707337 RepID=A0A8H6IRM2_9PEZI|nr:polyamine transporter tpo5 [Colletotrichum musicola]